MQLNDQNGSVGVICKHRFRRYFRGVGMRGVVMAAVVALYKK